MCYYILGAQPRLACQIRESGDADPFDTRDPDNAFASSWFCAIELVHEIAKESGSRFYETLLQVVERATEDAYHLVDHLWDTPLKIPLQFARFDSQEWQVVAHR